MQPISVNGVAVDRASAQTPELAVVRELLRQRAVAVGLLAAAAAESAVEAAIDMLIEREVPMPSATEAECRRYYEARPEAFRSGDLVYARHILFQVVSGIPVHRVRAKAEETLAGLLARPEGFAEAARSLSNCPTGGEGGHLGQLGRGETVPEFEQAIFGPAAIGIFPELVKTRFGFHIVAIDQRIPGETVPFELVRARIAEELEGQVCERALRQYVQLLAGQAQIIGVALEASPSPLLQ